MAKPKSNLVPALFIGTLVLSVPTIHLLLAGQVSGAAAAVRVGLAALVAYLAIRVVASLVTSYQRLSAGADPAEGAQPTSKVPPDLQ